MKKVEIKLNMNAVNLNQVGKTSQEWSQKLRTEIDKLEREEVRLEPLISAYANLLTSTEKIHSDVQAWEAEAKELFQAADNANIGNVKQLEAYIQSNPPSAGAIAILVYEVLKRERARALEVKNKSFAPIRKKGTQKKVDNARQLHDDIVKMNADLLARPASEGWGSKKKRAEHISKKTGRKFSYISKIIAIPQKTNQT